MALELRLAGRTYQQIADQLGYTSRAAVAVDIDRAHEQAVLERNANSELLVQEQLEIITRVRRANWVKMLEGDPKAAEIVMKCVDRAIKLQRLTPDAHISIEMLPVDVLQQQVVALAKQLELERGDYEWSDDVDEAEASTD